MKDRNQKPLETRGRVPEPPPKIVTGTQKPVAVSTKLGRATAPPPKIEGKK